MNKPINARIELVINKITSIIFYVEGGTWVLAPAFSNTPTNYISYRTPSYLHATFTTHTDTN